MAPNQLSITEQRQIIYSSLLRYSPETASLRDRALDRVVLGALIDSTADVPFQQLQIKKNIHFLKNGPSIRDEVIHETLARLERDGKIQKDERKRRRVFWLTEKGLAETNQTVANAGPIFEAAFDEVLKDTEQYFTREQGAMLCRKIVLECFARIGRGLAKSVIDAASSEPHFTESQIHELVRNSLGKATISDEAKTSLCARIYSFFRSKSHAATRLKFHLTQGYYFTELLGFENTSIDLLSEHSLRGGIFFLDTNVLLLAVFERGEDVRGFGEIVRLAQRIGITLAVTRATLNEIRNAAIEHVGQIKKFFGKLPEALTDKNHDTFYLSYNRILEREPGFTLDEFLDGFLALDKVLRDQWKIEIDERTDEEILGNAQFPEIEQAIHAESDAVPQRRKSAPILRHDICHFVLVRESRKINPKIWFLTQDRVLAKAAKRLIDKGGSSCFSLVGFLQSISPFLTTTEEEQPLGKILGEILDLQITKDGVLYESSELAIIAEMHADVLATPSDQLVMALDYVKTQELEGQPYNISEYGRVSLGLKKFLARAKDEQLRAYEAERSRLELAKEDARRAATEAQDKVNQQSIAVAGLRTEIATANEANAHLSQKLLMMEDQRLPRSVVIHAAIGGIVGLAAIIAAIQSSRVLDLLGASISDVWRRNLATIYDLVCMVGIVWAVSVQIPIFLKGEKSRTIAIYGIASLTVVLFTLINGHDGGRVNEVTDLVAKILSLVAFIAMRNAPRPRFLSSRNNDS